MHRSRPARPHERSLCPARGRAPGRSLLGDRCPAPGRSLRGAGGQAAVELVAVLPLVVALLAALWQLAVFAHTAWSASSAAHAAARAQAIGLPPAGAARAHLPARLERGLRLRTSTDGRVRVTVHVPSSFGLRLGTTSAVARFTPQR